MNLRNSVLSILLGFLTISACERGKALVWSYTTWKPFWGGWSDTGNPLIDGNNIYVCQGYGWDHKVKIIALEKTVGKEIWNFDIRWSCGGFTQTKDRIIAHASSYTIDKERAKLGPGKGIVWHNRISILDKKDGKLLDEIDGALPPVVTNRWLYFPQDDSLVRYDLETKLAVLKLDGKISSLSGFDDQLVFSLSNEIKEISDASRVPRTIARLQERPAGIKVSDRYICSYGFKDRSARLSCVSRTTNQIVWQGPEMTSASYSLADNVLYYWQGGNNRKTFRVDLKTGEHHALARPLVSSLIRNFGNTLLVTADAHEVIVLDPSDEKEIWRYHAKGWVKGLQYDGRLLFVADDSGTLSAFQLGGGVSR